MTFEELRKKVSSFGLAVVIYWGKLDADFISSLTFDQWLKVYYRAPSGSDLKTTALTKLSELEATFDQWLKVYDRAPSGSDLKTTALTKLSELAATFDQWLEVYDRALSGSDLKTTALTKLSELVT